MIKKERKIPLKILQMRALQRRLPQNHPTQSKIKVELAKSTAGYIGEDSLDYYLTFLAKEKYYIFHNLRLQSDEHFFQIDTLLVTPHFMTILEIKNIAGTLYFDEEFHQLIQSHNEQERSFPDPVLQVQRQHFQLQKWLKKYKFTNIPIENIVVISNSATTVKSSSLNSYSSKVIKSDYLPIKMKKLEQRYKNQILTKQELRKLSNRLIKSHQPVTTNILDQFQVNKNELIKGVHCPQCFTLPIIREHGGWICPTCNNNSKDAYLSSLTDYTLLIAPTISNCELCDFLQLSSRYIAASILKSMNLKYTGHRRGRRYELPEIDDAD